MRRDLAELNSNGATAHDLRRVFESEFSYTSFLSSDDRAIFYFFLPHDLRSKFLRLSLAPKTEPH